ncbi:SCO0930 family lipoprotein [Streptomyces sp. KMM 9044]|uniref:SCO0930 family lipoprotein n=1 Tax=Streptomyces sp. KMM 9044 TaxID=2744474 RepID=UPI002151A946|nr:SCO0930 family lipoprotein [Streptomyces sp. KMM 9044]WAX76596.1 SCO0930 family lipoprotein [Streptomyces sp. KMM 9044]
MKTSWRTASLVVSAAAVLTLTTACGQDTPPPASSQNVGASAAPGDLGGIDTGAGAEASASPAGGAGELAVASNAKLGKLVTDELGLTLYRFDQDTAEPPKSNCDGDCAETWPPVPAADAAAGEGIDESLLGEVTRADGTKQLTVDGWPAYHYIKDVNAGDVKGQGVGGKWFALTPEGKKAQEAGEQPGLSTRQDPELGEIVVDKDGRTVYRFMKDEAWPEPVSACTGACLEKWPVVAPVDINDTKGIQKKNYMTFTRPDNKAEQQTINCWPIYTFVGDEAAGDTNGQGVGGTWYAVRPNGEPVGAPEK